METVTYLISLYNNGPYLRDCLASLMRQTDPHWLALIVDDKSTDDSLAILQPFLNEKIRLLCNPRNLGTIGSLRRLLVEATTDIVAILDSDDALFPEATACLRRAYAENPGAAFVHSKVALFDESLSTRSLILGSAVPPGKTSLEAEMIRPLRSFRRSAYYRTSGLDDAMLYAEDVDWTYKLEEVAQPIFIDQVLYKYRTVASSQSHAQEKKAIGLRNQWCAKRNALARREIRGFERLLYHVFFCFDYLWDTDWFPRRVKFIPAFCRRSLSWLDKHLHLRKAGKLRREPRREKAARPA